MAIWSMIRVLLCGGLLAAAACSPSPATLLAGSPEPGRQKTELAPPTLVIPETTTSTQEPTLPLTGKGTPVAPQEYPDAVWSAFQDLLLRLKVEPDQIDLISFHEETWPDSCLGLAAPDEGCLQILTPGYLVLLEAGGNRYEYHTDETGRKMRVIGDTLLGEIEPGLDVQRPRAILLAIRALNQTTGIAISEIQLNSANAFRWPNACLGLEKPGETCAEVVTDGWIVILEAAGQAYEFRVDQSGEIVRGREH